MQTYEQMSHMTETTVFRALESDCSLHEFLLSRLKLQTDIASILMNWKVYKFVLTFDMVKMFRKILIAPEDRRYQNIDWFNVDSNDYKYI